MKITLTPEEARKIVWGDHNDFDPIQETVDGLTRWSVLKTAIFQRNSDQKFFEISWSEGATEQQYEEPFEYEKKVELQEVEEATKTITYYRPVES